MAIEVKVPMLPESITDATVSTWHKKAGDRVARDENIVDLETDKVMLEVPSPSDGIIKEIIKPTGSTVHAQEVIAVIGEGAADPKPAYQKPADQEHDQKPAAQKAEEKKTAPAAATMTASPPMSPSVRRVV